MEFTWDDVNCDKGFYVFDTDTKVLTKILNTEKMFYEFMFDDVMKTVPDFTGLDLNGKFVKLKARVIDKSDKTLKKIIAQVNEMCPHEFSVDVIDANKDNGVDMTVYSVDKASSMMDLVSNYIDKNDGINDTRKATAKGVIQSLWNEVAN